MRKLLIIIFLLSGYISFADEGDTIVVQTIDFTTPVNPGWNQPREGFYVFPSDSISFSKILMYHTLKCDPTQNPACGEWDYTTHNNLWYHTGTYDSNMFYHPNYIVGGGSPDSFMFMNDTSWKYRTWLQYSNYTSAVDLTEVGSNDGTLQINFPGTTDDQRMQFLYKADELIAAGLSAGDITGLQLSVSAIGGTLNKVCIRLSSTDLDSLTSGVFINEGLQTVFEKDHHFGNSGWNEFPFSFPFSWDGTSNLIVDFSYKEDGSTDEISLHSSSLDPGYSIVSKDENHCLYYHFGDFLEVPVDGIGTLDSAITITFWAYGNWLQPTNNSALEGINAEGDRVMNIHLPWSNGNVYWDCGTDGSYDRIFKGVSPDVYKGSWHHWAFTKDIATQQMRMYLDGIPFHIGSGKTKSISGISKFRIGSAANGGNHYEGMLDEICIFDKAIDYETIAEWVHKEVSPSHPDYSHLVAQFSFNEGTGFETDDNSTYGVNAPLYGYPEWMDYEGKKRVMNFDEITDRPIIILEKGIYDPLALDSVVRIDTMPNRQVMIVMYEDLQNPTNPTDTLSPWPHYYNNIVFDAGGVGTDSTLVIPDEILYKIESPYFVPYEILKKYELGRFITPYGNGLSLGDGFTWVFDVTDFRQFLADTVHLTAGNFQELLDLKFYMIEGTPPRDVVQIDRMWHGYWPLDQFNEKTIPKTMNLTPEAEMFKLKITTSGHEFDNATNCAEFCQKTHFVDVDSITQYDWEILDECADNPLYPQGGTWIYDRAGWCPGAKVTEQNWEITPYITTDSILLDYNCDHDPYGRYSVSSYFISYSGPNFTLDAAIDEVITPNNKKRYGRFNPLCSRPEIVIQNTGSDTLFSLDILYAPETAEVQTFHWEGSLGFLEKELVLLNPIDWTGWENGHNTFNVSIENPNGGSDQYEYNNTYETNFQLTPEYPESFIIKLRTNKVAYQNYYEILDNEGNVVFMKDGFENETIYEDTVYLGEGCYTFILHDSGDNGISFWANSQGSGYIYFKELDGSNLYYFNPDFGKFTQKEFTVGLAVDIVEPEYNSYLEVYPNPSSGLVHIDYSLEQAEDVEINIYDSKGVLIKNIVRKKSISGLIESNLSNYPSGLYFCAIRAGKTVEVKKLVLR